MRRAGIVLILLLAAAACTSGGPETRTVLVDFRHDQFTSMFLRFFPSAVQAHPGDKIEFSQWWTGEAHTVTGGKLADAVGKAVKPFLGKNAEGRDGDPKLQKALGRIGSPYGETNVNQTIGRPCYLRTGTPPSDGTPCARRAKPVFTGREALFNSGLIPYQGDQANRFDVQLSSDIKPGKYFFFCVTHGPGQSTFIDVKPKGTKVESNEASLARARREVDKLAKPLIAYRRGALRNNEVSIMGHKLKGPFAGLWTPDVGDGFVNEFVPKRLTTTVGKKVTWNFIGPPHTISFDVPKYFPIVTFSKNGNVSRNPALDTPAGGSAQLPETHEFPKRLIIDGGTYDGSGFWSSGSLIAQEDVQYSLRFSKPGTFKFACLIHPAMVGSITVRAR